MKRERIFVGWMWTKWTKPANAKAERNGKSAFLHFWNGVARLEPLAKSKRRNSRVARKKLTKCQVFLGQANGEHLCSMEPFRNPKWAKPAKASDEWSRKISWKRNFEAKFKERAARNFKTADFALQEDPFWRKSKILTKGGVARMWGETERSA